MPIRNQVEPEFDPGELMGEDALPEAKTLSEDEIIAIVSAEIENAAGSMTTSRLSENRRTSLQYYMGDYYGDEAEGRSQVVTTEFRDTVESLLPSLMKIFMASDTIVQYVPNLPQEEEGAKQASEYENYVFMQQNKGFIILYTMVKDALMYKNGLVKVYWDETKKTTTETYTGLSEMERDSLLQDEEVEPIEYSAYETQLPGGIGPDGLPLPPQPMVQCDMKIRRTKLIGQERVVNVPPEEFLISQRTAGIQESRFVGHRCRKSISELVEMGIPFEKAQDLSSNDAQGEYSLERHQRFLYDGEVTPLLDTGDKAARTVWITECYLLLDMDGDGVAERWKITVAGSGHEILSMEEWEGDWPFESISPIIMQHKFYGLSIFDLVMQWQRIQSTLTRQFLDNTYSINNNRIAVNADRVNLDDLLTNRPNSLVRTIGNPAEVLMPMQPTPLGAMLIPSMEYFNAQREKATGVTSYNQGLDADSLNKTASGISQIMGAAQERVLLIARIFAETGITGIFNQLLKLTCKHQNKEKMIRLRGKWVQIDPRQWSEGMAAVTDVALGTNNRDQMLMHLNQMLSLQQQAMMSGMSLVTPKNIYNTLTKIVENSGLKHVEAYFTDPDQAPPAQPKPSEAEIQSQTLKELEMIKAQSKQAETDKNIQAENAQKLAALQHEANRAQLESRDREADRELKLRIAREANLTTLVQGGQKSADQATATKEKEKTKRGPSRLEVTRDPQTREITGIMPIYEEIKETAEPEPPEYKMAQELLK